MMRTEPATTLAGRRLRLAPRLISARRGRGAWRRSRNVTFELVEPRGFGLVEPRARRGAEGVGADTTLPSPIRKSSIPASSRSGREPAQAADILALCHGVAFGCVKLACHGRPRFAL